MERIEHFDASSRSILSEKLNPLGDDVVTRSDHSVVTRSDHSVVTRWDGNIVTGSHNEHNRRGRSRITRPRPLRAPSSRQALWLSNY